MTAMLAGNFEAAWQESDLIRLQGSPDPHRFWNGESLQGARVIVRCLHGLGDAVQMFRYAPGLQALAKHVIFEVAPHMLPLAPFFRGVKHPITWGRVAPDAEVEWNMQAEIMELPYIFRTTPLDLPIEANYLNLPECVLSRTADLMGQRHKPRIGIVWTAGEWNPQRSIPLSALRSLLAVKTFEFWNLQGGTASFLLQSDQVRNATQMCGDGLVATAATIQNLDLLITIDTLAAHLAGALGRPVWLMLQYAADWRWMTARNSSPWYPSMRLFRQAKPGDWSGVVEAVQLALNALPGSADDD